MRGKRTDIDFSKHELTITKQDGLLIHHLAKPNRYQGNIKFINTNGVLVVTGDYSNWMFCREFHPSSEGAVSGGYWLEKLKMHSCQEPSKYDSEATREAINEQLNGGLVEYGYEGEELDKMNEYFEECLSHVEDEWAYLYHARQYPSFADAEQIIFRKGINIQLRCVFDAFDEICRRIKESEFSVSDLTSQTISEQIENNEGFI